MDLLTQIAATDADHIPEVVSVAMQRYRELFPDWDIFYCSIDKSRSRNEQLDLHISMLERLKELEGDHL